MCEGVFAFNGLLDHLYDLLAELVVEQVGFFLAGGGDDFQGEVHVAAFVAEHPVGAGGEAVEQTFGAQEIHIGERREEEQPLYAGGEADEVEEEPLAVLAGLEGGELVDGIYPAEAEVGFLADGRDVLHGGEGFVTLLRVGDVVVQQGEIELDVQGFFVELARQIHPSLGRIDVLVEIDDEVVGHDSVARSEERHQTVDEMPLLRRELAAEVVKVVREINLVHRPCVLDGIPIHLVKSRIPHRPQGELIARVEQPASPRLRRSEGVSGEGVGG